jgi:hypothetical protein
MENRSNALAADGGTSRTNPVLQIREDWRLAREAQKDLQIAGMPHTNLLLAGHAGAIRIVLEMLWLDLREPILKWRPGQRLELPLSGSAATLILHDVDALTSDDQRRVLRWLDETAGQIRVVSTTAAALWPRVKAGAFSDVLYYRLNTVYVDVRA